MSDDSFDSFFANKDFDFDHSSDISEASSGEHNSKSNSFEKSIQEKAFLEGFENHMRMNVVLFNSFIASDQSLCGFVKMVLSKGIKDGSVFLEVHTCAEDVTGGNNKNNQGSPMSTLSNGTNHSGVSKSNFKHLHRKPSTFLTVPKSPIEKRSLLSPQSSTPINSELEKLKSSTDMSLSQGISFENKNLGAELFKPSNTLEIPKTIQMPLQGSPKELPPISFQIQKPEKKRNSLFEVFQKSESKGAFLKKLPPNSIRPAEDDLNLDETTFKSDFKHLSTSGEREIRRMSCNFLEPGKGQTIPSSQMTSLKPQLAQSLFIDIPENVKSPTGLDSKPQIGRQSLDEFKTNSKTLFKETYEIFNFSQPYNYLGKLVIPFRIHLDDQLGCSSFMKVSTVEEILASTDHSLDLKRYFRNINDKNKSFLSAGVTHYLRVYYASNKVQKEMEEKNLDAKRLGLGFAESSISFSVYPRLESLKASSHLCQSVFEQTHKLNRCLPFRVKCPVNCKIKVQQSTISRSSPFIKLKIVTESVRPLNFKFLEVDINMEIKQVKQLAPGVRSLAMEDKKKLTLRSLSIKLSDIEIITSDEVKQELNLIPDSEQSSKKPSKKGLLGQSLFQRQKTLNHLTTRSYKVSLKLKKDMLKLENISTPGIKVDYSIDIYFSKEVKARSQFIQSFEVFFVNTPKELYSTTIAMQSRYFEALNRKIAKNGDRAVALPFTETFIGSAQAEPVKKRKKSFVFDASSPTEMTGCFLGLPNLADSKVGLKTRTRSFEYTPSSNSKTQNI